MYKEIISVGLSSGVNDIESSAKLQTYFCKSPETGGRYMSKPRITTGLKNWFVICDSYTTDSYNDT